VYTDAQIASRGKNGFRGSLGEINSQRKMSDMESQRLEPHLPMKKAPSIPEESQKGFTLSLLVCFLSFSSPIAMADDDNRRPEWRAFSDGIEHATLLNGTAHAFRIDIRQMKLTVRQSNEGKSVHDFAKDSKAALAINGNFFDPQYRTQGLLISDYKHLSRFKQVDWGVFAISRNRAQITHSRQWTSKRATSAEFAIQCGPRLLVNYRVLSLKAQWARRTAIGVEADPHFVLILAVDTRILTSELAKLMKRLGARYAMNLDGGSSTQLWTNAPAEAKLTGVRVANAILVSKR